jgi:hypothetical protein
LTARADDPRQQGGVVAGAGADLEHALARAQVELLEHRSARPEGRRLPDVPVLGGTA